MDRSLEWKLFVVLFGPRNISKAVKVGKILQPIRESSQDDYYAAHHYTLPTDSSTNIADTNSLHIMAEGQTTRPALRRRY
jgi:hypothetical protein